MTDNLNTVKINLNNDQIDAKHPLRTPYHHGDLRQALIVAGEAILAERGVEGFSLREAARRAGVSAGAPAHHFGDARGLLTAIATLGFQGLEQALAEACEPSLGLSRATALRAQGAAYVRFALSQPARFDLMWRRDCLNHDDAAYGAASSAAFMRLYRAIVPEGSGPPDPCAPDASVLAAWSIVHGYATLARMGMFDPGDPGQLQAVLDHLTLTLA
jgi:AcrR family transcriptional regulator